MAPKIFFSVFLFLFFSGNVSAQNTCKPWTWWSWMGNSVNEKDISEQLQWMHDNGMGGVSILPIYGVKGEEPNYIPFLSDRWMDMLEHTIKTARELGMDVDMTMGTGWPFGGPGINATTSASCIKCVKEKMQGGTLYQKDFAPQDPNFPDELIDLKAISDNGATVNLTPLLKNGQIKYTLGEGDWTIYEIYRSYTKMMVKRPAPGGAGLVIDYFSKDAINIYMEWFEKAFSGRSKVRAFFNDSFESYGTNFTPSFFNEFKQRRGYELSPYLHLLFAGIANDTVKRVLQDYNRTISDLLLDNFTGPFVEKSNRMGIKTVNQAHGSPGNLLDLYACSDIPQAEIYGSSNFPIPGVRVDPYHINRASHTPDVLMMKFSSSAGHVMNKKLVASEACTWLGDHFQVALSQVKPQIDELFAAGINHIFYNGTTYSPMSDPFPGWLIYPTTNFNHNAPYAEYFSELNQYIANCQQILQETKPDNDILLYFPFHECSMKIGGAALAPLLTVHSSVVWLNNTSFGKLARLLQQTGYAFDYVSDFQLTQLKISNGMIIAPGATYRTIIVPDCKQLPFETYRVLLDLAAHGVKIIFDGEYPADVTGLYRYKDSTQEAATMVQKWNALPNVVLGDVEQILQKDEIYPENIALQGLSFIRKQNQDGKVYFITNLNNSFTSGWVTLNVNGNSALEYYDPLTNERYAVSTKKTGSKAEFFLSLLPGQSCFIFEKKQSKALPQNNHVCAKTYELSGTWAVDFVKGEPKLPKPYQTDSLASWTLSADTACWYFNGKAKYSFSFNNRKEFKQSKQLVLDLGDVRDMATIYLNGKLIGKSWCVPFHVPFPKSLLKGKNYLEIEVTNLSYNRVIYLDKIGYPWKKFHDINMVHIRGVPFNAANDQPIPSGLLGPVKILY